ncbi:hypothetical protein [Vulcanisaeta sp. JCM 16159]|uniref:hypothetical protein n=1 Tax=Vulcanisaeta sp. JCM 16159 TaxID=1295371 RepID=UPI000A3FE5D3|nr:hypothetical protein [Vulcanisaeta sp. JCM 16159]
MVSIAQTALNTLFWEAAVMLLVIGFVNMGVGKNEPRDFGIVLLSGALMETIAMAFVIVEGDIFGATVAAAFVLLLWMLGIGLIMGKNLMAMNHALWFTGLFFALITVELIRMGTVMLSFAIGLLPIITILLSIVHYLNKPSIGKVAGVISIIDGFAFFVLAFAGAAGIVLP